VDDPLAEVPLFAGLDEASRHRLLTEAAHVHLPAGEELFAEGDPGQHAYVITAGRVDIVKRSDDREVVLADRGPGEVIGEMALLGSAHRMAGARAVTDTELLAVGRPTFEALVGGSATAARVLVEGVLARWRETEGRLRQSERMAQLGTLTAGVAHELNNPAAALERAAVQLRRAVEDGLAAQSALAALQLDDGTRLEVERLLAQVRDAARHPVVLDPLTGADREAALEAWLTHRGVPRPWSLATDLVALGVEATDLGPRWLPDLGGTTLATVVGAVVAEGIVHGLVDQVERAGRRITTVVGALRSYSHLDRGAVHDVDVAAGIEDTLVLLGPRLRGVAVTLEVPDGLPPVEGNGAELNQVWTNLLANAADALEEAGTPEPTVTVRALDRGRRLVVEVEDNGPGVPPELTERIFDPFFTTKAPGRGTGLGLDISRDIVVVRHGGELEVDSLPGRTTFRVALPLHPAGSAG
jgi:signal transduction histidine kinase